MNTSPPDSNDPSDQTGVADVRVVRDKIAALYDGNLREHVAQTDALVEPLIDKLGLKRGLPPRKDDRRSGTEG
jgi:hypothetical protein